MNRLQGTWRLVDWSASIGGKPVRPFGGDTTGLITYTEESRMWGTLMRVDRENVDAPTLAAASVEERAVAAAGYLNYAGTYRIEGNSVIHFVEVSLYPNWIGGEQVRRIDWVENPAGGYDLVLSARDTRPDGSEIANRLQWRRLAEWDQSLS